MTSAAPKVVERSASEKAASGNLLNAFAWTLIGKFGLNLSSLVVGSLITRALGPSGRGVFAEMQTWIGLSAALFGFSLDTAIYHFANRERYPVDDGVRLTLTLISSAVTAVLAAVAMTALVSLFPEKISAEALALFPLMFGAVIATVLATNLVTLAQALGRVKLAAAISAGQGLTGLVLIGGAFFTHGITLRFAFATVVVTQSVSATGALYGFLRSNPLSVDGLTRKLALSFIGAGLKQHVATVSVFVYTKLNLLIVFRYCGAEEAGLLATSWVLAFGVQGLFGSFQLALYPRVLHHADDFMISIRSMRAAIFVGFAATLPVLLFARPVLHAYGGGAFEAATPSFRILTVSAWLMFVCSLAAPYLVKAGAFVLGSACSLLIGIVSVGANFFLVRAYQANGGAAATLVAVVLCFVLTLWMLRFVSGRSPNGVFVPDFRAEYGEVRALVATHAGRLRRSRTSEK